MKELRTALRIARELSEITDTLRKLTEEIESLEGENCEEGVGDVKGDLSRDKQPWESNGAAKSESKDRELDVEAVRSVLAHIARGGKRDKVRSLILEFGGEKLTDLKPECYEELVERAKRI